MLIVNLPVPCGVPVVLGVVVAEPAVDAVVCSAVVFTWTGVVGVVGVGVNGVVLNEQNDEMRQRFKTLTEKICSASNKLY